MELVPGVEPMAVSQATFETKRALRPQNRLALHGFPRWVLHKLFFQTFPVYGKKTNSFRDPHLRHGVLHGGPRGRPWFPGRDRISYTVNTSSAHAVGTSVYNETSSDRPQVSDCTIGNQWDVSGKFRLSSRLSPPKAFVPTPPPPVKAGSRPA